MARERGYVLDYHKALAAADFETLRAINNLIDTVYVRPRRLDRKTQESIFVHGLTILRAGKGHIQSHIRVALDLGVSPEEILEAIQRAA